MSCENCDKMRRVLEAVRLRMIFVGWPAEPMWQPHDKPVPDWRNEFAMIADALGEPITLEEALLEVSNYRLSGQYQYVRISRSCGRSDDWWVCKGEANGAEADYFREGAGWVIDNPTRYKTPTDAAVAFLSWARSQEKP